MRDAEDNDEEATRELFEALQARFGSVTESRTLNKDQEAVLRRAERIHRSLVRPEGAGPRPAEFPSGDGMKVHDVEPRQVRRGETVTFVGKDLYGVRDVRVGGAPAPIVKRGDDPNTQRDTIQVFIPDDARNGSVRVNRKHQQHLELTLVGDDDDDDDGRAS